MKLYTCEGSRGLRATWALKEMGVACDIVMLPFPPRAKAKDYFAVNPLATVPALQDGEDLLTESCAIVQYLATRYSPGQLAVQPEEPDYGPYLDFLHHADATLTFPQTVALRFSIFERDRGLAAAGDAYGEWFGKRLVKIDQRLQDRAFLCAGRFTVADIAVGYALHLTHMSRLADHLTPRLRDWLDSLRARSAFQAAVAWEAAEARAQGVR